MLASILLGQAPACQICIPLPTKTLVDYLLNCEGAVFARAHPDKPFEFTATEFLKGQAGLPPVGLFIDSPTRRTLANNPSHRVICVWNAEEDKRGWKRVGAIDDEVGEKLVRDILANAEIWKSQPDKRITYFADKLGSSQPFIQTLAYLEVGQAPYSTIRSLKNAVPREDLRAFLSDIRMMEWHALYILLLGNSGHPGDQQLIRDRVNAQIKWWTNYLPAAWAAALIEVDGAKGLEFLDRGFLDDPGRKLEEVAVIVSALRVHGNGGRPELLDQIVEIYGRLLISHPALAPELAEDLTRWKRFDHIKVFETLLDRPDNDLDFAMLLRKHLRNAPPIPTTPENHLPMKSGIFLIAFVLVVLPTLLVAKRFSQVSNSVA